MPTMRLCAVEGSPTRLRRRSKRLGSLTQRLPPSPVAGPDHEPPALRATIADIVSSIALPGLPAPLSLLSDLFGMSTRIRAAWARPPKASADEIADEIRDTLRLIENVTATLVRVEGEARDAGAKLEGHAHEFDQVPREFAARMVADAEAMLATLPPELDEDGPFGRLMKNVVEPYNDALRRYRRVVQDYLASCRRMLAEIDAHGAEDARIARALAADESDAVVPWAAVRDNVRKIR